VNYENKVRVAWGEKEHVVVGSRFLSFRFVSFRSFARSVQLHFAPLTGVRSDIVEKSNLCLISHTTTKEEKFAIAGCGYYEREDNEDEQEL
jgi:hypothetical protein